MHCKQQQHLRVLHNAKDAPLVEVRMIVFCCDFFFSGIEYEYATMRFRDATESAV